LEGRSYNGRPAAPQGECGAYFFPAPREKSG